MEDLGKNLSVLGTRRPQQTTLLLRQSDAGAPLGRITLAGEIRHGQGVVPALPLRVYGRYALMYVLEGRGAYQDANGLSLPLTAGDLVFVFPELAHTYGPPAGERWSEFYLVFEGPCFDVWRGTGLLDARQPVCHLEPIRDWYARLKTIADAARPASASERLREICAFQQLLADMLATRPALPIAGSDPPWLTAARILLETDLGEEIDLEDVAAQTGLGYETFRKRFQQAVGVSPARYRAERRIDAACELFRYTRLTNRQIAESLGFGDEFYFSKRFKQITGHSPRAFRARLGAA